LPACFGRRFSGLGADFVRSCYHAIVPAQVKTIGSSGQISLGKENAGRTVTVEEIETGVWLVKTAQVIPDTELWLHEPGVKRDLDRAIAWAEQNPAKATNLSGFEKRIQRRR